MENAFEGYRERCKELHHDWKLAELQALLARFELQGKATLALQWAVAPDACRGAPRDRVAARRGQWAQSRDDFVEQLLGLRDANEGQPMQIDEHANFSRIGTGRATEYRFGVER